MRKKFIEYQRVVRRVDTPFANSLIINKNSFKIILRVKKIFVYLHSKSPKNRGEYTNH